MSEKCVCCGSDLPDAAAIHGVDRLEGLPGEFVVKICPHCGYGVTLPIVSEAELADLYPQDYSPYVDATAPQGVLGPLKRWLRERIENREMRRQPISALEGKTGSVLDVGCGRGDLGARLIARGWKATGIEPAENACEHARAKGVEALQGTLGTVDLRGRTFDAVTFMHSLEHVYDPRVDLARAHSITAPGGKLLISVPNFGSRQRRLFNKNWFHLDLPRHRHHYTPEGLAAVVSGAGFRVESVTTATSVIGLPASLSYRCFGEWRFDGPNGQRLIAYTGLLLYPVAALLARFGGGDYLHLVATRDAA